MGIGVVGRSIKCMITDSRIDLESQAIEGESPVSEIGSWHESVPEYRGAGGILREPAGTIR